MSGWYQIECWGAQGGTDSGAHAANPGYAKGNVYLDKSSITYIEIGEHGKAGTTQTPYNGGSKATLGNGPYGWASGGGGCSHIAKKAGELYTYGTPEEAEKYVYMVAGGSGGAADGASARGYGGGLSGQNGTDGAKAGTQTSGYKFGRGQNAWPNTPTSYAQGPGGGGGWYGGCRSGKDAQFQSGAGGSGHITESLVTDGQTIGNVALPSGENRLLPFNTSGYVKFYLIQRD